MTPELEQLQLHMSRSGLPARLTSGQRPPRFAGDKSYHRLGLAADFAGPTPWNQATVEPRLLAIWKYWMEVAGSLEELIYSGGTHWISKGRALPISSLPASLRAQHWNHVHVAVSRPWTAPKGIVVPEPTPVEGPPNIDINGTAVSISAFANAEGICTGYMILGSDGGVFGFGPGARYFGRVH